MFYSENIPYNLDPSPRCNTTGCDFNLCNPSICHYPAVYDYRMYGFYGALAVALISYGYIIATLIKKQKDAQFHKAFWLLAPLVPIAWIGIVYLYFSIYPS